MSYQAKIILDSVNAFGDRLTTFELTYPRYVHNEFMTHRMLSRNAASNRAIPFAKTMQRVLDNPVIPLEFGKNKPGMQAREVLTGLEYTQALEIWLRARDDAVQRAFKLSTLGTHKQVVNRLLEPFQFITTIATATDWPHFFNLRAHPDAQPEIRHIAELALEEYKYSPPTRINTGGWHLPYILEEDRNSGLSLQDLIHISTARCARVSYLTHAGIRDCTEDIKLCYKLIKARPMHASPMEHPACAWVKSEYAGNFKGWLQFRKQIPGEYTRELTNGY